MAGKFIPGALLCCEILVLIFMLTPLLISRWIYQDDGVSYWIGSLTKVNTSSSPGITEIGISSWTSVGTWDGMKYQDLRDKICDEYDKLEELYGDNDSSLDDSYEALCNAFINLYGGGIVFIAISSFDICLWFVKFITLILIFRNLESRTSKDFVIMLTVIITISYAIGYAVWMGTSKSSLMHDCDQFYDGSKQATACGSMGPSFALFTLAFNICYAPIFLCVIIKKFYRMGETSTSQTEANSDNNILHYILSQA